MQHSKERSAKNRGTHKRDNAFIFASADSFGLSLLKGEGRVRVLDFGILSCPTTPHLNPLPLQQGERRGDEHAKS